MRRKSILLTLMLTTCSEAYGLSKDAVGWASTYIQPDEELLCATENNGNWFFAALSDGRLKTGYRIDVTSATGAPNAFLIRWMIQNDRGIAIGAPDNPEVVHQRYARVADSIFAEEVLYRRVYLQDVMGVSIFAALEIYGPLDEPPEMGSEVDMPTVFTCKADTSKRAKHHERHRMLGRM